MSQLPSARLCAHPESLAACLAARVPQLVKMLVRRGLAHHDAEDAVQQAVFLVLRYIESGRSAEIKNPLSWLRTVAANAGTTILRRRRCSSLCSCQEPSITPFDDIDLRDEQEVRLAAIRLAVSELKPDLREVFFLHYGQGLTIQEAATRLGSPRGTVNGQLIRARECIRSRLRAEGFEVPESPKFHEASALKIGLGSS